MQFRSQVIDKERGIILSEKRARDLVDSRASEEQTKFLLPGNRLAERTPIGLTPVIERAQEQLFESFYNGWYRPDAMIVAQVGWPRAIAATDVVWEPWSAERVEKLVAERRPIYVDFTARWCATRQTNKKVVFGSDHVKRYFHTHRIVALKGDWTNSDARIMAELATWSRAGAVQSGLPRA